MVNNIDTPCHITKETHNFWELIYINSGNLEINIEEQTFSLSAGQSIFYSPKTVHNENNILKNSKSIIAFQVTSDIMSVFNKRILIFNKKEKEMLDKIISEGIECFDPLPTDCPCVGQRIKEGIAEYRIQLIKNNIESLLIELYHKIISENSDNSCQNSSNNKNYKEELTNNITTYLKNNINKNLSLKQISDNTGIGISQMKKIFKDKFDCGIIDYFLNLKIEEAKKMIKTSSLNFTQISETLGFNSIHYFSKSFKKRTNMTPSQFSKSLDK